MSFLRLIRFPNLVIVALTQYLLYQRIILPALDNQQIVRTLPQDQFLLFIIVTVFITAGGYIINDIIDVKIDSLNKPLKIIIGRKITMVTAYWLYFCFNLLGFLFALYLALVGNRMSLLFIFPGAVIGLLLYSAFLKKRPLSGNLLVSLYCAGVALIIWIAEQPSLLQLSGTAFTYVAHLFTYYAVFAFFATLFREIVKDLEDATGDAAAGAQTAPIAWGVTPAKRLASTAVIVLLLYLLYFSYIMFERVPLAGSIGLSALIILIGIAFVRLIAAKEIRQYHELSQLAKGIMLAGILLLLLL